jgi:Ca2+/Na+ antiporter
MKNKGYIFSIIQLFVLVLSLITDWYQPLVVILTVSTFMLVLDKLGRGIVLREMMAMHGCFVCLAMPLIGYLVYNKSNQLALLWVRYMPVSQEQYFEFALPAMAAFVCTVCWPMNDPRSTDHGKPLEGILGRAKTLLERQPMVGIYLLIIGASVYSVSGYLPVALQFAFLLFYFSSFAGLLYVYFTPKVKYKRIILVVFAAFLIYNALRTGMFTIIAYMGITIFSFFFVGRRVAIWKKLLVFLVGAFALVVIQSVKQNFRSKTWKKNYEGNRAVLFSNLVMERMESQVGFTSADAFFPIYYRTNQGFNVGMVMRHIPAQKPHDNGKNLMSTLAASLVPRVFWPDKPEAGGKFNMKYYTGYILRGWSTNIGPLGEAYGSFGIAGGIAYMLFLGAFIRWAYKKVFSLSIRTPLLLFWIPVLFYQVTYSLESDTLQILNSLFKAAFFVWVLAKLLPSWFGIIRAQVKKRQVLQYQ